MGGWAVPTPIPSHPVRDDTRISPRRGDVYNPVQDALEISYSIPCGTE